MAYELIKQTKFLNFTELPATGKTRIIGVGNNSGEKLALIKWSTGWRRYVFHPMPETVYDTKCMNEIMDFIEQLMEERK